MYLRLGPYLSILIAICWLSIITFNSSFDQKISEKVTQAVWPEKKSPNVYKSCPKMISLDKWLILTPFQKLPTNVGDLGKLIVAKGF